jgi:biopolymer transport protein ExbD
MLRTGTSRRRKLPVNAEINITNLVDVAFVLLIIFMITAPILQGGIDVDLPTADASPLQNTDPIIVSIDAQRAIYVGDVLQTSLDEMQQTLEVYLGDDKQRPVSLKLDRAVTADDFLPVMGRMLSMGISNLGLPVTPNPQRRR